MPVNEQMRRACENALADDPLAQKLAQFLHGESGEIETYRRSGDGKPQYRTHDGQVFDSQHAAYVHGSAGVFRRMAEIAREVIARG